MKRKLYVDGNTVYGIDEECLIQKRQEENYRNRQDLDALWARYQEQEEQKEEDFAEKEIEREEIVEEL